MSQHKSKKSTFSKQKSSAHTESQIKFKFKTQIININSLNPKNGTLISKKAIKQ